MTKKRKKQANQKKPIEEIKEQPKSYRNLAFLIPIFFVALVVVFFHEPLLMSRHTFFSDATYIFYPFHKTVARAVHSGVLPLWNPYNAMGFPFIGDPQSMMLYPPIWLLSLLPFDAFYMWFVFLHYFVAALGMYLLVRKLNYSIAAAVWGGIIFAFSGYLVSVHIFGNFYSSVWAPFVFYGIVRLRDKPSLVNLIISSVLISL
ncbi:MAG: hypothetical protein AB1546_11475, partial [bacterium]